MKPIPEHLARSTSQRYARHPENWGSAVFGLVSILL